MKNKFTYLAALALVATQMIGCTATKTTSNTNSIKNNFSSMGANTTCKLANPTRKEQKYLAYVNYCEALKASYAHSSTTEVANNAVNAGGAYMYITYQNQHKQLVAAPVANAKTVAAATTATTATAELAQK